MLSGIRQGVCCYFGQRGKYRIVEGRGGHVSRIGQRGAIDSHVGHVSFGSEFQMIMKKLVAKSSIYHYTNKKIRNGNDLFENHIK